ncbi:hypothetical protein L208DRAFT_529712 [Tricholoma matsutake]|nr:hypothetical protein L208DRAFT_529712 [Tricholoma matsutake 945]
MEVYINHFAFFLCRLTVSILLDHQSRCGCNGQHYSASQVTPLTRSWTPLTWSWSRNQDLFHPRHLHQSTCHHPHHPTIQQILARFQSPFDHLPSHPYHSGLGLIQAQLQAYWETQPDHHQTPCQQRHYPRVAFRHLLPQSRH